jgi:hypothetical protein
MKFLGDPSSGSYQGKTYSRNRFGQYLRTRAIPVNPNTVFQAGARARLGGNAADWRGLTALQRAGWGALGLSMTRTDSLGQTYSLNGFGAFCSVNNNLAAAGDAALAAAPALITPGVLLTATITLTAAAASIAYTTTPLAAGVRLFSFMSPQRSPGRSFEADYRLIQVSAAAAASPANVFTAYTTRFGTPVVTNKVFFSLQLYEGGFVGAPVLVAAIVA